MTGTPARIGLLVAGAAAVAAVLAFVRGPGSAPAAPAFRVLKHHSQTLSYIATADDFDRWWPAAKAAMETLSTSLE